MEVKALELVAAEPSRDTVEALEHLLRQAQKGQLTGLAFVALYRGRHVEASATGEVIRNPIFARGMLRVLDDKLVEI